MRTEGAEAWTCRVLGVGCGVHGCSGVLLLVARMRMKGAEAWNYRVQSVGCRVHNLPAHLA